ncbi:MAG: hypothetical protein Q9227_000794 [Pyrenula ochraceoflavens]
MSDAWFAHKLAPDGDIEDGVHPNEAQALKQLLRNQISLQAAAVAITKPIETSSNPNLDLARLWGFMADALIELPAENVGLLLALLQAIENLPQPDFSKVEKANLPAHGALWRGLPGFGHHFADAYQSDEWRKTKNIINIDDVRAFQVRRANVEARLAVGAIGRIPIDWGYECVADALERTTDNPVVLDIEVSAAAEWLFIAGERFRVGAAQAEESWALARHRTLWNKGNTMTLERLTFWKRRLEELKNASGNDEVERALKSL